jgi:hypothetical protein
MLHRNSATRGRCAALAAALDTSGRSDKTPVLAPSCRASSVLSATARVNHIGREDELARPRDGQEPFVWAVACRRVATAWARLARLVGVHLRCPAAHAYSVVGDIAVPLGARPLGGLPIGTALLDCGLLAVLAGCPCADVRQVFPADTGTRGGVHERPTAALGARACAVGRRGPRAPAPVGRESSAGGAGGRRWRWRRRGSGAPRPRRRCAEGLLGAVPSPPGLGSPAARTACGAGRPTAWRCRAVRPAGGGPRAGQRRKRGTRTRPSRVKLRTRCAVWTPEAWPPSWSPRVGETYGGGCSQPR